MADFHKPSTSNSCALQIVDNSSNSSVYIQEDLATNAFPIFSEVRQQGKLCDVTIKCGERSFEAHRIVLTATIPYFQGMFTTDMIESKQKEITIIGIDPTALEALINFAYSGRISLGINNVQSLMVASSFLQLNKVQNACSEFLKTRLHPSNVLGIKSFADTLGCANLVSEAGKFVRKHFCEVSKSDEFLNLSKTEIKDMVDCDQLYVASEEVVFEAIMSWVKKDVPNRSSHLADLLSRVRMPLLTPHFLSDKVATEELIRSSHQCRDLVDEAKDYHLMPERRPLLQTFKTRPRNCSDVLGMVYAVGGLTKSGDSLSTVEVYDPIVARWRMAEAMTMLRSRVGVVVMKSKLYAIGGYNGQERLSTVEVFDPCSRTWAKVASMNCKRSAVGAASLHDKLYACGGYDGVSSLNTVECYDPDRNEWFMVTSMAKHRSAAGVIAFGGAIYALGGHDGLSIFDSVERYDPQTAQWTMVTPMLTKRCRLGVASLDGRLYVCGGYDGSTFLRTVEVYDATANKWHYISPMNVTRSRVALVSNCKKLYAIGGYDGMTNLSTMEVYDPEIDQWSFGAAMCAHEGGVGVGVIPTV